MKRTPVVAIMGHVDHGKTTLLDYLMNSRIAEKESGGITQSVRSFMYTAKEDRSITFIDTPGHEAFFKIRERGSKVADIVVLVVAVDDGVKPQTKEVINLILSQNIPTIVAINKIDLPNANSDKVKRELVANGILLEGFGGNVPFCEISAKNGTNIENLIDTILLYWDMSEDETTHEEKSDVNSAIVLESFLNKKEGHQYLVIVKSGEIKTGDYLINTTLKVRSIIDDRGKRITRATVSMPVILSGMNESKSCGETIYFSNTIVKNTGNKDENIVKKDDKSFSNDRFNIFDALNTEKEKKAGRNLLVILKTDSNGSNEAIIEYIKSVKQDLPIDIFYSRNGDINESDVTSAEASGAIIVGFNVSIEDRIDKYAKSKKIVVMIYKVIYELIDDLISAAQAMSTGEIQETKIGSSKVLQVFTLSNGMFVAGCRVMEGKLQKGLIARITRRGSVCYEGRIISIKHLKEEIKESLKGSECGLTLSPNYESQTGDTIDCIKK